MLAIIDSNVALYAFADYRDRRKSSVARDLLLQLAVDRACVISIQVMNEFANVCTRKLQSQISQTSLLLRLHQLGEIPMVKTNAALVISATRRHQVSQISFYDALMVEAGLAAGAEVLYTEDLNHDQQFETLRVVNPFL